MRLDGGAEETELKHRKPAVFCLHHRKSPKTAPKLYPIAKHGESPETQEKLMCSAGIPK